MHREYLLLCLKDRFVGFLGQNSIVSRRQFGFVGGLSTTDAMCELCNCITRTLDEGKKTLAVFLDLAKAFDTVPHELLLEVLHTYGIRGPVLNVLSSYLIDRKQVVKIGDVVSDPLKIKIGIPQGTVLGPILFILYINSLTNMRVPNGMLLSYADDTVVVFSGDSWQSVKQYMIDGLISIKTWLETFKLTLNVTKTKYIAFSITSANRPDFDHVNIENFDNGICEVDFIKYLGIMIDKNLKWDHHINKLTSNIRKLIYKFYTLRDILTKKLLLNVYRALIESLMGYGVVVWGGLYKNSLKPLNVAQNYILKVILRKEKRFPTNQLYSEEVLPVRAMYCLRICSLVHKSIQSKLPIDHIHDTRRKIDRMLPLPQNKTSKKLRSFLYLSPKIYNLLPLNIRNLPSLKLFNKACRVYVFGNFELFGLLF